MSLLRMLPRLLGVLHGLSGKFVTAQVLSLAVMLGRSLMGMGGEKVKLGGSLMCVLHSSILLLGLLVKGTTRRTAIKPRPRSPARMARDSNGTLPRCSDLLAAKEVPLISSRGVARPFEGRLRPATMKAIARERIMMTNCKKLLVKQQSGRWIMPLS
jgi:hypothetical protein